MLHYARPPAVQRWSVVHGDAILAIIKVVEELDWAGPNWRDDLRGRGAIRELSELPK